MKDNKVEIDPWIYNKRVEKTLSKRDSKGKFTSLYDAGFIDSNKLLDPDDLYGDYNQPEIYFEMRHAHDIISSIMSFRRNSVYNIEYDIVPCTEEPTIKQQVAAEAVKSLIENMPYCDLNEFVATTYDEIATYGFSLYEIWIPEEGPNKNKLHLLPIPSFLVEYWILDETDTHLKAVRINTGDTFREIPVEKIVWFGKQSYPGNFFGISDLRKLLSIYSAYKEDLKNYLSLRRLQNGVLYFQEKDNGNNTESSWDVAANYLIQYFQGNATPLILNSGMELKHLNATQPGIDGYHNIFGYFDKKITAALDSSLNNLGIDGVGSLALGKEVSIKDHEKFVAHVNSFLSMVNGKTAPESHLLRTITELLGFDPDVCTPQIIAIDNTEANLAESIQIAFGAIKDGIFTREDFGEENIKRVIDELGFSTEHLDKEEQNQRPSHDSYMAETSYLKSPDKYSHIDFKPPSGVAQAAAKGLEYRRKAGGEGGLSRKEASKEGIGSGVQRAANLKNRDNISPEVINQMVSFFARHEKNKSISEENRGTPWNDKGYVAWLLWGGDAGQRWANKIKRQMEAADKESKMAEAQEVYNIKPSVLEEVYSRGETSFEKINKPNKTKHEHAMERIDMFIKMSEDPDSVKSGYRKADGDLLSEI